MAEYYCVEDIPEGDRFTLVSDSEEVREILEYLGMEDEDYNYLWVAAEDGDYTEVWASYGVGLHKMAWKLL